MLKNIILESHGEGYYPLIYGDEFVMLQAPHYTGETFGGGVVFYTWSGGTHGLICSKDDLGRNTWGCAGSIMGATGLTIGTGYANTITIANNCGESNCAAKTCINSSYSGFTDWYLPSRDELYEIYNVRSLINAAGVHWCSSERVANPGTYVYSFSITNGSKWEQFKTSNNYVIGVRQF